MIFSDPVVVVVAVVAAVAAVAAAAAAAAAAAVFLWHALGKLPLGYVQILLGVVSTICYTQCAGVLFHGIPKSHST